MGAGASSASPPPTPDAKSDLSKGKQIESLSQGSGKPTLVPVVSMKQLNDVLSQQEDAQSERGNSSAPVHNIVPTVVHPPLAVVSPVATNVQKKLDEELFKNL